MISLFTFSTGLLSTIAVPCIFIGVLISSINSRMSQPPVPVGPVYSDTAIVEGRMLMSLSDCYTCHADKKVLTAPSYDEIAERYKKMDERTIIPKLITKVIEGGKGEWGDKPMNPHPELLHEDARKMIQYILHLSKK